MNKNITMSLEGRNVHSFNLDTCKRKRDLSNKLGYENSQSFFRAKTAVVKQNTNIKYPQQKR